LSNTCSRFSQSGQGTGNARQQALRTRRGFGCLFHSLDLVPAAQHVVRGFRVAVGEYVRVAAHQFAVDRQQRVGDIEAAFLGGHLREEHGLEKQVAEFVGEAVPVAGIDRVEHLIGFFEEIGLDGVEVLFAIPRAAAGGSQARHDLDQAGEGGSGGLLGFCHGNLKIITRV